MNVFDSDMISEWELNADLCNADGNRSTLDDLPPLTIKEIGEDQGRDAHLLIVPTWIATASRLIPTDVIGYPSAFPTYASMREEIYLLDNFLVLVEYLLLDNEY